MVSLCFASMLQKEHNLTFLICFDYAVIYVLGGAQNVGPEKRVEPWSRSKSGLVYFPITNWITNICDFYFLVISVRSQKSLNQAKRNVINYYGAVGYMEDMRGFISVLEERYPFFFNGALKIYDEKGKTT